MAKEIPTQSTSVAHSVSADSVRPTTLCSSITDTTHLKPRPILVEEKDMSLYFPFSRWWWQRKRIAGDGPPFSQAEPGGKVVYNLDKVTAWFEQRERTSTTNNGAAYRTRNAELARAAKAAKRANGSHN